MAALAALMGCPCMAQSEDSIESRNKAIVKASFEVWASGAGSPYDLPADHASWSIVGHSVASKIYPSKEAFLPRSSARSTPG
jgi:uncharacterized protein